MEEQVNMAGGMGGIGGLIAEVVATQRQDLARANVLSQVRSRPPTRVQRRGFAARGFASRLMESLPRLRFAVPTLAAVGAVALWVGTQPAALTFSVGEAGGNGKIAGTQSKQRMTGATGQTIEAPADGILPLRFSDGSEVTLESGARVQVTSLEGGSATLRLQKGRAEVSVRHRRQTHWVLRAGSFEVTVTGTRFSIDWEDRSQALTVVMTEGTVEIGGSHLAGGSPIAVAAGQKFHATTRESRWTLASAGAPEPGVAGAAARSFDIVPSAPPPAASPSEPTPTTAAPTPAVRAGGSPATVRSWQVLARSGRYQEALQLVEKSGFEKACARLGAEDLVQLGDAARLARDAHRAEQAYRMARKRFPSADRPAFALGLVAFEQRQDFRTAARWFDLYARKYPNGPLATEAVGREMESWHRAGDSARARRAARTYLTQAPAGPYAPLARQIAAP